MSSQSAISSLSLAEKQWRDACTLVNEFNHLATDLILDGKNADQVIKMLFEAEDMRGIYAKAYLDSMHRSKQC